MLAGVSTPRFERTRESSLRLGLLPEVVSVGSATD
jgi:hypothetical protein